MLFQFHRSTCLEFTACHSVSVQNPSQDFPVLTGLFTNLGRPFLWACCEYVYTYIYIYICARKVCGSYWVFILQNDLHCIRAIHCDYLPQSRLPGGDRLLFLDKARFERASPLTNEAAIPAISSSEHWQAACRVWKSMKKISEVDFKQQPSAGKLTLMTVSITLSGSPRSGCNNKQQGDPSTTRNHSTVRNSHSSQEQ